MLFRGITVTRNTVSKNIQPSYSVKVREMSAGSLRLQNYYPLSCDYFMYFYIFIYLFHPCVAAGIQPSAGTLWCHQWTPALLNVLVALPWTVRL